MTNARIIEDEAQRLLAEGKINPTGRTYTAKLDDGTEITVQEAEPIHTFQVWKSLGYHVRKGEHAVTAILIWKHTGAKLEEIPMQDGDNVEFVDKGHMFRKVAYFFALHQVEKEGPAEDRPLPPIEDTTEEPAPEADKAPEVDPEEAIEYFVLNHETGKLELYFKKSTYQALPENVKSEIKSYFRFSRASGAWISKAAKNTRYPERVARSAGLPYGGIINADLTDAEIIERKAERAAAKADYLEAKAEKADAKGRELTKPIDDMRGDIAFFTQPNINTSAGRAFTRQRERMFASFDKGMQEHSKADYYREKAERARAEAEALAEQIRID